MNKISSSFKNAFKIWQKDNPALLSAGISYFTLFSIVPMMVIGASVAGRLFREYLARAEIFDEVSSLLSVDAASAIQTFIFAADRSAASVTLIGIVILFWSASRAFWALQTALNLVWGVEIKPRRVHQHLMDRVKAFLMILGLGILLSAFFAVDLSWALYKHTLHDYLPPVAVRVVFVSISYALFLGLFVVMSGIIFKVMPNTRILWKEIWPGALVSAVLFAIARYLIGLYFSWSMLASVYGAASSAIVLLVWVYFATQIILFGAAYCRAWSRPDTVSAPTDGRTIKI